MLTEIVQVCCIYSGVWIILKKVQNDIQVDITYSFYYCCLLSYFTFQ